MAATAATFTYQVRPNALGTWSVGQTRVAFTPWVSLVINKLGWTWINPDEPIPGIGDGRSTYRASRMTASNAPFLCDRSRRRTCNLLFPSYLYCLEIMC